MRWLAERQFSQSPTDPEFIRNPYACYAELHRRGGPVYWQEYGLWCLAAFPAVDRALRDRRFARLPPSGEQPAWPAHLDDFAATERHSLLALEPPEHTRLRRVVHSAFLARQIRPLTRLIRQLCDTAIDRLATQLESGRQADLIEHFATPVPVTIIAGLLGMPASESHHLLHWSHAMVRVYTGQQTRAEEQAANDAARDFSDRLQRLIETKRRAPGDDLISAMLATRSAATPPALHPTGSDAPELTDAEIISMAILLLNAGHEATVQQIGNAVLALLRSPAALRERLADDAWAERVVEEALRYDPSLHLFTRYAQTRISLGDDVTLAAGEQVALLLGAANHDPQRFSEPQRFNPAREDAGQVAFGAGVHFCVGASLARLEMRIALASLFERLPDLVLAAEPLYRDNYHFHGLQQLYVQRGTPTAGH